jgi:hypothetical protein
MTYAFNELDTPANLQPYGYSSADLESSAAWDPGLDFEIPNWPAIPFPTWADLVDSLGLPHGSDWADWADWFGGSFDAALKGESLFTPFIWDHYGMNCHQIDTMSVQDFERMITYAGPWVRIGVHTDEVAEGNWDYRLWPGLDRLRQAGQNLGIEPNILIILGGYSTYSSGDSRLLQDLSWDEKSRRYQNLAYSLVTQVQSWGFDNIIYESWNEPDHPDPVLGIGVEAGTPEFFEGITTLSQGFAQGVHQAGGQAAFASFMSINQTKFDLLEQVWVAVGDDFDYFNGHLYDDDPIETFYWARRTRNFTEDTPVLITEHGFQHYHKNSNRYRGQAWALYVGFKNGEDSTLQGIMNYVYRSDHEPWVIDDSDDFFWEVTHGQRP